MGAALNGTYGMSLVINDTTDMYLTDTTPAADKTYRARFYIDPNTLTMANNNEITVLQALSFGSQVMFVVLKYTTVLGYIIYAATRDDASGFTFINANSISDAVHYVEVFWKASTAPGANNGYLELFIDGSSAGTITNTDNDTRSVTDVRFGAQGKDAGTSGTFYMDDFASNNDGSVIGAVVSGGKIKVWNGSAFVEKPVKVWNGSAFVEKPLKRYNGSSWELT